MRRREFITLVGAAAWPLAARAQKAVPVFTPFQIAGERAHSDAWKADLVHLQTG